eukprot:CAMPEP_0179232234 /NCGR_PEP_ID=MMETSP0797-20121207/11755_1 /TAXON_ID=47934 /ORGANISM="Dinophysis acuminata, Strain DAEP01" /LENGTH=279 /DNA_ID=CAMNT_0020939349 /DNA_START=1 /DNA_END=841 /DNA_ORIENTATION=-
MVELAAQRAREACDQRPGRKLKVAGSLPPLAASYRPDLVGPFEENAANYRLIAKKLAPFVDIYICETMSTADEGRAALTGCAGNGKPCWVSWTLDEKSPVLRSGESLEEAVAALKRVDGWESSLKACLLNCTSPEITSVAMPMLRRLLPDAIEIGGYANGFVTASSGSGEYRDLGPEEYYDAFVAKWIAGGATIVAAAAASSRTTSPTSRSRSSREAGQAGRARRGAGLGTGRVSAPPSSLAPAGAALPALVPCHSRNPSLGFAPAAFVPSRSRVCGSL